MPKLPGLPKPPGSDLAVEREKIRLELSRANDLLSSLKLEINILETRRKEIRADIDAETRQMKLQRTQELQKLVDEAGTHVAPLLAERKAINSDIGQMTRKKIELEGEVAGLDGQITSTRDTLGQVNREVEAARHAKETLDSSAVAASAQITNLTSRIHPLQEELATLTQEVRATTDQRDGAFKELVALQNTLLARKDELKLEIAGLERRRNEVATKLSGEVNALTQDRTELTKWAETLAKQEKIIRAREFKVAIAEQKIADNVNLLNL